MLNRRIYFVAPEGAPLTKTIKDCQIHIIVKYGPNATWCYAGITLALPLCPDENDDLQ